MSQIVTRAREPSVNGSHLFVDLLATESHPTQGESDAAGQLRSEAPKLLVILDALAHLDTSGQFAHDQLPDAKVDVLR